MKMSIVLCFIGLLLVTSYTESAKIDDIYYSNGGNALPHLNNNNNDDDDDDSSKTYNNAGFDDFSKLIVWKK